MPKRINHIFEQVVSFENLFYAAEGAKKNKQLKFEVCLFNSNLESNIIKIKRELEREAWLPQNYHRFLVFEPKERIIWSPTFRDKVVHRAIGQVLLPYLMKKWIYHSYGCIPEKGVHKAASYVQYGMRKVRRNNPDKEPYIIKADIRKFYDSIDREILKKELRHNIKDKKTLKLLDLIIDTYPRRDNDGVPHGSYLSSIFANLYLNKLDHYLKEELKIDVYARYLDDFILVVESKERAREVLEKINNYVKNNLKLELNTKKTNIVPIHKGVTFVGYRIFTTHMLPKKENVNRMRRRLRRVFRLYRDGKVDYNLFVSVANGIWQALKGYLRHCDSYTLTKNLWIEMNQKLDEYKAITATKNNDDDDVLDFTEF